MISSKKAFFFDLDGTLIDSFSDVYRCINSALNKMNIATLSKRDIIALIGPDLKQSMTTQFQSISFDYDLFIDYYRLYYNQSNTIETQLYDFVEETLLSLTNNGYCLAVLTNKPENQAVDILEQLGVAHFFSKIAGPDTYDCPKPDPAGLIALSRELGFKKEDVVFVGDTPTDMMTASQINVISVAATYGYGDISDLQACSPDYFIDSMKALLTIVQ